VLNFEHLCGKSNIHFIASFYTYSKQETSVMLPTLLRSWVHQLHSFQSISQPISVPIFTRKQASTTFTFSATINTKIFFQSAQLWHIFFYVGPSKNFKDERDACKTQKKNNKTKSPKSQQKSNEFNERKWRKSKDLNKTKQKVTKRAGKNCYKQAAYN